MGRQRKHLNYPNLRSSGARTQEEMIWNKKLDKTTDSQILWITYTLICYNELFQLARRFWVDASAQAATHGAVLGRILDFEMYEDLKWRFTWKEKVDGRVERAGRPGVGPGQTNGITVPWFPQWMMYWLEFLVTENISLLCKKKLATQLPVSPGKKFQTKTAFGLIRPCLPEHLQNERVKLSDGLHHTHYTVMRFAFLDVLWESRHQPRQHN